MLVIISDLHLTDGSSGEIISEAAFRLFRGRLSDMAYDASWRCKGSHCTTCREDAGCEKVYQPIESFDIILLGDILDMIRSEQWNQAPDSVLPWSSPWQDEFFTTVNTIVDGILQYNAGSFRILEGIAHNGDIKIPAAMKQASDTKKATEKIVHEAVGEVNVKVNIHYMIGNHDWFFYIDDPRMDTIRNKVIRALGLANPLNTPFPYHRSDSVAIETIQNNHSVFAEHGDEFDKTNYQTPHRDASSVGDVVVIKLLNMIPAGIEQYLVEQAGLDRNSDKVKNFVRNLREIDNLRPYTLAASWIMQVAQTADLDNDLLDKATRHALNIALKNFVKSPLVAASRKLKMQMTIARWVVNAIGIGPLSWLVDHTQFGQDKMESYRAYALQLSARHNYSFFVMGHTHYAELVPLGSYNNNKNGKIYLNTGTWRTVHLRSIADNSFISHKTITMAGFFKNDERRGRPFEFWTGALAL
ncbi:metallophosphoesterase family protein [Deminuibacter soli]|uniref:Uncharacterized protein n=1 Tax=Deminuibacter soli TaxID=2291815 RepID=A0A3E1ND40_9BACT|nr:hypothetical protein [Deminuibacter soli]RFM25747.1 hypothetical protein DXN05_23225 [Deminuibacter soli]